MPSEPADAHIRIQAIKEGSFTTTHKCAPRARFTNSKIVTYRTTEHYREWITAPNLRRESVHPSAHELRHLTARPHLISLLAEQFPMTLPEEVAWLRRSYKLKRYTPLNPTYGRPWAEASDVASSDSSVSNDALEKGGLLTLRQALRTAPAMNSKNDWAQGSADVKKTAATPVLPGLYSPYSRWQLPRRPSAVSNGKVKSATASKVANPLLALANYRYHPRVQSSKIPLMVRTETKIGSDTTSERCRHCESTIPTPVSIHGSNSQPSRIPSCRTCNEARGCLDNAIQKDAISSSAQSRENIEVLAALDLFADDHTHKLATQTQLVASQVSQIIEILQREYPRLNAFEEQHESPDFGTSDALLHHGIAHFRMREYVRVAVGRLHCRYPNTRSIATEALVELVREVACEVFGGDEDVV